MRWPWPIPVRDLSFGPEYLIPEALRPAPDRQDRPGRCPGRHGFGRRYASDHRLGRLPCQAVRVRLSHRRRHARHLPGGASGSRASASFLPKAKMSACLRAAQVVIEEKFARPLLIGRPGVIEHRPGKSQACASSQCVDFDIVNPESDERYRECWTGLPQGSWRVSGITPAIAKEAMRRKPTVIGAMLLKLGYADGLICGMTGQYSHHHRRDQPDHRQASPVSAPWRR